MINLIIALVACTGSMQPEFTCNQTIELTQEFNLTHGGVYVYNNSERLILHRLQWYTRDWAIFKADNALHYDKPVLRADILYMVVGEKNGNEKKD